MSTKREDIRKRMPMTYEGTALEKFGKRCSALSLIAQEYDNAIKLYNLDPALDIYSMMLFKMDKIEAEVRKKAPERDVEKMKKKAVLVAVTAMRFIVDVCMGSSREQRAEGGEQRTCNVPDGRRNR